MSINRKVILRETIIKIIILTLLVVYEIAKGTQHIPDAMTGLSAISTENQHNLKSLDEQLKPFIR